MATLTNGSFVSVFQSDGGHDSIEYGIYQQDGTLDVRASVNGVGVFTDDNSPDVAALTGGGFVVTWVDVDSDGAGNAGIRAAIHSNGGGLVISSFQVNTTTAGFQGEPRVTALEDGGFVIVWDDDIVGIQAFRAQRFYSGGLKRGDEFIVDVGDDYHADIALLDDGRFAISHTETSGATADIEFRVYDPRDATEANPITGSNGDDNITARLTASYIDGLDGDDHIVGSSEDDILKGGAGNDLIVAEDGDDILQGGPGDDVLNGRGGSDTASYEDATASVLVSLAIIGAQDVGGGLGMDMLAAIDNLIGSDFADRLTGDSGVNILVGGDGNDSLDGGEGDASVIDALYGGVGDDTYIVNSTSSAIDIVFEGNGSPGGVDDIDTIISKGDFFWDFYNVGEVLTIASSVSVDSTMVSGTQDSNMHGNDATNFLLTYGGSNLVLPRAGIDVIDMGLYGLSEAFNGPNTVSLATGDDTNYNYSFESGKDSVDVSFYSRFTDGAEMLANFVDAPWGTYVWMGDHFGESEFVGIVGLSKADLDAGDFLTS